MRSEDIFFIKDDMNKSHDELLSIIVDLRKQLLEYEGYITENSVVLKAMHKEYQNIKEENEYLRQENKALSEALTLVAEKNLLRTNDLYGRGSEKLSDAMEYTLEDKGEVDESDTEDSYSPDSSKNTNHPPKKPSQNASNTKGGRKPKSSIDLSGLPSVSRFLLDIPHLNATYGEGNWRIAFWQSHRSLEHVKSPIYVVNYYTPVISIGLEHKLKTIPYDSLLPKSMVSASLMSEIYYQKVFMGNPLYRIAQSWDNHGLTLTRQTMSNWFLFFAFEFFAMIKERLQELMLLIPYHQCDESTLQVIHDGRKAGAKSYIWVHTTSELCDTNPIVLFCYELTRGTDHLREFYKDFEGYISCDAYCSYHTLGEENMNVIIICGCMMHMRRRFHQSLLLINKDGMDQKVLEELPEVKVLSLIGQVYDEDQKLKQLSAEERQSIREQKVRPLLDELFSYIESLDATDPLMSPRLKDAIGYAINQKEYLYRFLDNGNIPIDNGNAERHIRPLAIGRSNFLFCNTVEGAEALAIMYSIVETAKANHANVRTYLRYVLETMPKYMSGTDRSFIDQMLPWSEEYKEYEKIQSGKVDLLDDLPGYAERPKTPRKSDVSAKTETALCS